MGRFFLDLEYTNGNYYLGDIIEIAVVSDDGQTFQSYIKIKYLIPRIVRNLTGITDKKLENLDYLLKQSFEI